MVTGGNRPLAAAAGVLLDRCLGERPLRPHPVALFGTTMNGVEGRLYRPGYLHGVLHATAGLAIGAVAGRATRSTALASYVAVAGRGLAEAAGQVGAALEAGQLDRARHLLPALAGRDASRLDEKQVSRAVVESVAENTVDALVAPALWAAVLGAPGALGYRAVNTMDAMVGHRSPRYQRYGWASARLDDVAGWLPARATAALVAVARPAAAGEVWRTVRRDAPGHPSPNAGVAEAAFAAALGLRLGGENRYGDRVELRPPLGDGRPPEPGDIARAARLSSQVGALLVGGLALGGLLQRKSEHR
jgi:adenosylcobinamide-phosphate synthase